MSVLAADLALARTNFIVFAETVVTDEKTSRPIRFAPHHRAIIDMIDLAFEEGRYLFCLAPVRHAKTTIMETLILFILGLQPSTRCKIVGANQDRAKERVNKIRKVLLRSGRYRGIFPSTRVAGKGRVDRIHLDRADGARDPALDACGVTTGIEGASVDLLCLDDCDDRRSQVSASRRAEVRLAVTETFLNRLEPGSNVVAIATRWSPEDLFGAFGEDEEACTRWTFFQEDIPDDLAHINAAEIGAGQVIFLPIGWQAALLPQESGAADEADVA